MDLFTSHQNHKLPRVMSWRPHPKVLTYSAMQHAWKKLGNLYVCPPLELHSSDPTETEEGATGGHPDNTFLAIGDMVPDSPGDSSDSTNAGTPSGSSIRAGKRKQQPAQERQMESIGVARKRTQQRYKTTWVAFLNWVQEGPFDLDIKSAVLAVFEDAEAIEQEHCFKEFMRAAGSSVVVDTENDDYDISRVLNHFRNGPSNMGLDMQDLAR
ncbi:unnamed protein product [Mortierella alpina]